MMWHLLMATHHIYMYPKLIFVYSNEIPLSLTHCYDSGYLTFTNFDRENYN